MKKNKKKNKLVIFTGYACNNKCVFCINANKRDLKPKTTEEILKEIYIAKKKNIDILELIGGEPTIRKDFLTLVSSAKKIGIPDIIIATNGRMFSNFDFAQKAVEAGLSSIIFSVHGANKETHDSLTQVKGSYEQLVLGIKNLQKLKFKKINGNTTVVKQNMKELGEIAKFYIKNKIKNVEYIFVDPNYGGAHDNFFKYVPKISIASKYMRKALDIGLKVNFNQWKVRYVPLCYFKGYFSQISEINERKLFFVKHSAPDFKNEDVLSSRIIAGRKKTKKCLGCKYFSICEGIWVEYLKQYGDDELKPYDK